MIPSAEGRSSWHMAARLLATTEVSVSEIAREVDVTEFQIYLWLSDEKFARLMEGWKNESGL